MRVLYLTAALAAVSVCALHLFAKAPATSLWQTSPKPPLGPAYAIAWFEHKRKKGKGAGRPLY